AARKSRRPIPRPWFRPATLLRRTAARRPLQGSHTFANVLSACRSHTARTADPRLPTPRLIVRSRATFRPVRCAQTPVAYGSRKSLFRADIPRGTFPRYGGQSPSRFHPKSNPPLPLLPPTLVALLQKSAPAPRCPGNLRCIGPCSQLKWPGLSRKRQTRWNSADSARAIPGFLDPWNKSAMAVHPSWRCTPRSVRRAQIVPHRQSRVQTLAACTWGLLRCQRSGGTATPLLRWQSPARLQAPRAEGSAIY